MSLNPGHYKLEVWQEAMRLVRRVYVVSEQMPDKERFGLQTQLRRAAISVPSNIAEGAARGGKIEYALSTDSPGFSHGTGYATLAVSGPWVLRL